MIELYSCVEVRMRVCLCAFNKPRQAVNRYPSLHNSTLWFTQSTVMPGMCVMESVWNTRFLSVYTLPSPGCMYIIIGQAGVAKYIYKCRVK